MKIYILAIVSILFINENLLSQIVFEAEDAVFSSGKVDNKHLGFTGDGFVDTENKQGESIEWTFNALKSVSDSIGIRYALGKNEDRSMQLFLNDILIDTLPFDSTGTFTDYTYKYSKGLVKLGSNSLKLVSINEFGAPNIDHLSVKIDTQVFVKLNVLIEGDGEIELNPTFDSIRYGTRIQLTARANVGASFKSWSGDINGVNNPLAFTVDNNYNLSANFKSSMPAFPGAEGFGAVTIGGRGGDVIEVTNLNDSGEGSFRAAIEASGSRTVIFRVSGNIQLKSTLSIKNNNITIAGQTAPGEGITVSGFTLKIDADNVIIRYIRSRLGDQQGSQDDAINCRKHKNIIVDHCSFSWSVDEVASFYDNENVTIQYCIMSEALYLSIHDKGKHSYGGIIGGKGASFHHNLYANNTSRNPRFCGTRYSNQPELELVDFRNNVISNWGFNSAYGAEGGSYNLVNNYYKAGKATQSNVRTRIIAPNADEGGNNQPAGVWGMFYVNGNYITASESVTENNWAGVHANTDKTQILTEIEFLCDSITTHSAPMAYEHVLAQVGAVIPKRDVVDVRLINEIISGAPVFGSTYGKAKGIIDSQEEVGSWPVLESTLPPADRDLDGMPDDWEDANALDKNNSEDRNHDANGDGYTNLETYLNELVSAYVYLIRPTNFAIESLNDLEVNLQWDDKVKNETGFKLERKKQGEAYEVIAKIGADITSYTDNLPEMGTYAYRLAAIKGDVQSLYTDSLLLELNTSINTMEGTGFRVYPNPVEDLLQIELNNSSDRGANIKVISPLGNKVWYNAFTYNKSTTINMDGFPIGLYFIHFTSGSINTVQKVVKTK